MRIKEGHRWLKDNRIGIVFSYEAGQNDRWYNKFGKEWDGTASNDIDIQAWKDLGFVECTESEARKLLTSK